MGIPLCAVEQMLHAVGCRVACRFGEVPAVFALERTQQSNEVLQGAMLHFTPAKAPSNAGKQVLQMFYPMRAELDELRENFLHCRSLPKALLQKSLGQDAEKLFPEIYNCSISSTLSI
jgi:hypothetical protein